MIREGFSEMLRLEQSPKEDEGANHAEIGGGWATEGRARAKATRWQDARHLHGVSEQSWQRVGMRSGRGWGQASIGADGAELGKP